MFESPWPWLALLAVLCLWMLGAYNRLVALRAAILAAWNQADAVFKTRNQVVAALLTAVQSQLDDEPAALEATSAAQAALQSSWEGVRPRPAAAEAVRALAAADAALAARLARLVALVEQRSALMADAGVVAQLQALRELEPRLAFARQNFNDAAERYDVALRQFPTRLLQSVFRFAPAGRL